MPLTEATGISSTAQEWVTSSFPAGHVNAVCFDQLGSHERWWPEPPAGNTWGREILDQHHDRPGYQQFLITRSATDFPQLENQVRVWITKHPELDEVIGNVNLTDLTPFQAAYIACALPATEINYLKFSRTGTNYNLDKPELVDERDVQQLAELDQVGANAILTKKTGVCRHYPAVASCIFDLLKSLQTGNQLHDAYLLFMSNSDKNEFLTIDGADQHDFNALVILRGGKLIYSILDPTWGKSRERLPSETISEAVLPQPEHLDFTLKRPATILDILENDLGSGMNYPDSRIALVSILDQIIRASHILEIDADVSTSLWRTWEAKLMLLHPDTFPIEKKLATFRLIMDSQSDRRERASALGSVLRATEINLLDDYNLRRDLLNELRLLTDPQDIFVDPELKAKLISAATYHLAIRSRNELLFRSPAATIGTGEQATQLAVNLNNATTADQNLAMKQLLEVLHDHPQSKSYLRFESYLNAADAIDEIAGSVMNFAHLLLDWHTGHLGYRPPEIALEYLSLRCTVLGNLIELCRLNYDYARQWDADIQMPVWASYYELLTIISRLSSASQ